MAVARLATRQDGVVSRQQLAALGLSRRAVEHRIRTGRLIVLYRGIYAVGHTALTDRSRAQAALLAAGPDAVLSHRAAAAFLKLIPSMPPSVDVTVTATRARRSRPGLNIHETRIPAGLPRPHVNYRLGPYEFDFFWPNERVIVETDGYRAHGRRAAFEDDRARDADLQSRGYVVLRFTWRRLKNEPLLVAARLARALSLRSLSQPGRAAA